MKIISGGQTGADRGGLDFAIANSLPHGGWCPKGRLAEDGRIPDCYNLVETNTALYPPRTALNVRDSDGTVIFNLGIDMERGSALTIELCIAAKKPFLLIHDKQTAVDLIRDFLKTHKIKVLNVAGNRESKCPRLQAYVKDVLNLAFKMGY